MFIVLGGNVDTFESIGYFNEYDASLTHIAYAQWISLIKSCGTLSLIYLLIFLWFLFYNKRALTFLAIIILVFSYYQAYEAYSVEFDKHVCALTTFDLKRRALMQKHAPQLLEVLAQVNTTPNLVRLFSFPPYPLVLLSFSLNNYALSKHGGRGSSLFSILIFHLHNS